MIKLLSMVMVLVLSSAFLFAEEGVYSEHLQKTQGIMGQPDREGMSKSWLLGDKMREEDGENVTIIRFDQDKVYTMMPAQKQYFEMTLADISKMVKMGMGMMQNEGDLKFTFEKTGNERKIRDWDCYEVVATSKIMTQHLWLTEDLPFKKEDFYQFYKRQPEMEELVEAFHNNKDLKGYPVLTEAEVQMMGMKIKSSTELIKIQKQNIDASLFDVPADYQKIENPMQQMLDQLPE